MCEVNAAHLFHFSAAQSPRGRYLYLSKVCSDGSVDEVEFQFRDSRQPHIDFSACTCLGTWYIAHIRLIAIGSTTLPNVMESNTDLVL
jgi:hypothetical protein